MLVFLWAFTQLCSVGKRGGVAALGKLFLHVFLSLDMSNDLFHWDPQEVTGIMVHLDS